MYKLSSMLKIKFFIIIFSILSFQTHAGDNDIKKNMIFVGGHDAKIKIKIFSSLTCPHCANFHIKIVSKIKKNYVETGLVQLIFIDFPLDEGAFNASKLLHCAEKNNQMEFLDTIYKKQSEWTNGSDINSINTNLKKISKDFGINSNQFDKCLVNNVVSDRILNGRIDASKKYSVDSTPTIVINEEKFEGPISFKNIKKKLEKII